MAVIRRSNLRRYRVMQCIARKLASPEAESGICSFFVHESYQRKTQQNCVFPQLVEVVCAIDCRNFPLTESGEVGKTLAHYVIADTFEEGTDAGFCSELRAMWPVLSWPANCIKSSFIL